MSIDWSILVIIFFSNATPNGPERKREWKRETRDYLHPIDFNEIKLIDIYEKRFPFEKGEKAGAVKMWNGKCHPGKEAPPGTIQNQSNLNIRNGPSNGDTSSMRSVSSEDISTSDLPSYCCSSNATNPAIKSGRRFQLLQVRC